MKNTIFECSVNKFALALYTYATKSSLLACSNGRNACVIVTRVYVVYVVHEVLCNFKIIAIDNVWTYFPTLHYYTTLRKICGFCKPTVAWLQRTT